MERKTFSFFFFQGSCNATPDMGGTLAISSPDTCDLSRIEAVPNTGHNINLHYSASVASGRILDIVHSRGM